jgi:PAS domain S-box-containing protein
MTSNAVDFQRAAHWDAAEAHWRDILEVLPAAAYTCDENGLITYFNDIAASVWGRVPKLRDRSERYCGSYRMYLTDGTPVRHEKCWMALAILEGKEYRGREIVIERPDGSRTIGEAYAHPLRNNRGQLVGAVNLVADVTALKAPVADNLKSHRSSLPRDAVLAMIDVALSLTALTTFERA